MGNRSRVYDHRDVVGVKMERDVDVVDRTLLPATETFAVGDRVDVVETISGAVAWCATSCMSDKVFVDTNVLVYAHDLDAGERHEVAARLVADLWEARTAVISTQVLQEFYVNATRKKIGRAHV